MLHINEKNTEMWIFIYDIPRTTPNYAKNESFYFDRNTRRIQCVMKRYLRNLEDWLKMWRLKTSGSKCSYNIYQKNHKSKEELNLQIFGEKIVRDQNPKYLGVILDSNMSIKPYVKHIRILNNKKWKIPATNILSNDFKAGIEEEDEELIQPPTKRINRTGSQNVAHEKVTCKTCGEEINVWFRLDNLKSDIRSFIFDNNSKSHSLKSLQVSKKI
ncbi:hypothetical protein BpHYR1_013473 [Brachionus plicatilis]|uniref:RNA-directed DNA polymerase from mobile element jockey-like n=1 Tax=Brachionus plicatilis TaxID=10195 RepID=A0A3M7SD59_BRAPC|nr:hypothetical protein BpHYR1_013473 [Brachionus plicatilis]